jgi:hypothetical protein
METWLFRDGVFNVSKALQFKIDLIQFYLRIARRGDAVTVLTLDAASGAERPRPEFHFPNPRRSDGRLAGPARTGTPGAPRSLSGIQRNVRIPAAHLFAKVIRNQLAVEAAILDEYFAGPRARDNHSRDVHSGDI